jgi:chromosome segregation ATPase
MNKKRSFLGYDPQEVHERIESLQQTYANERNKLESELDELNHGNEQLRLRLDEEKRRLEGKHSLEKELKGSFLHTQSDIAKTIVVPINSKVTKWKMWATR